MSHYNIQAFFKVTNPKLREKNTAEALKPPDQWEMTRCFGSQGIGTTSTLPHPIMHAVLIQNMQLESPQTQIIMAKLIKSSD